MIACGSFTGSGNVSLGWEPQYVLFKKTDDAGPWAIHDRMRGFPIGSVFPAGPETLEANTSSVVYTNGWQIEPSSTGFKHSAGSSNFIYMAIRGPMMKEPEAGTEVFAGDYRTSGFTAGFPVDMAFMRNMYVTGDWELGSRLQGARKLATNGTAAEVSDSNFVFDSMTDFYSASPPYNYQSWMFKRAKGFFDVVAYDGIGGTQAAKHSLGVAPELLIVKARSGTYTGYDWQVLHTDTDVGKFLALNKDQGQVGSTDSWSNTRPTDTVFTVGPDNNVSGNKCIAYLFATLEGVSKVGSYTGNGSSQNIACGFSGGARFVMIKRTDATGDWYIWDTERGIVAGNDPHLSLNTTAAQVSTDDSIDPQSAGFTVNQVTATNINVTNGTYIFLAIA
jgi:hypothetical protein